MAVNYYELFDDMSLRGRWHLKGPVTASGREVDPRIFTEGKPVEVREPLHLPLRREGTRLDFTLADFGMPVLHSAFAKALAEVAPHEIQRFAASVEGTSEAFEIINVVTRVDCLDPERSSVSYWTEADGIPDLVGRLQTVVGLKVDPQRASGHHIFRLQGWEVALIVSEDVKDALQDARGAVFQAV